MTAALCHLYPSKFGREKEEAFLELNPQCTSRDCWRSPYCGSSYLPVILICVHLPHGTEWSCDIRPTGVAPSAETGPGSGMLLAGLYYSTSQSLPLQGYVAFASCFLMPSASPVPHGGGPGHQATKLAIVQWTLHLTGSAFLHAAVGPPWSSMEWMVCFLSPIWTGFDRWMSA